MNKLTQFTTSQLIRELIRRKLIKITPQAVDLTEEFMNELKKDEFKYQDSKCRVCGSFMISGDLCWECSEKLKKPNNYEKRRTKNQNSTTH